MSTTTALYTLDMLGIYDFYVLTALELQRLRGVLLLH